MLGQQYLEAAAHQGLHIIDPGDVNIPQRRRQRQLSQGLDAALVIVRLIHHRARKPDTIRIQQIDGPGDAHPQIATGAVELLGTLEAHCR